MRGSRGGFLRTYYCTVLERVEVAVLLAALVIALEDMAK